VLTYVTPSKPSPIFVPADTGPNVANSAKRVLLVSIGTAGDVFPFIAMGSALQKIGHDVVFLANDQFKGRIERAGITFASLGTAAEYSAFACHPEFVNSRRAQGFIMRDLILPNITKVARLVESMHQEQKFDAVVRHMLNFGLDSILERHNIPGAVGVLSPAFWFSDYDPALIPGLFEESKPQWVLNCARRIGRIATRFTIDPKINAEREKLGLPPQQDNLRNEFLGTGADLNLGLWSRYVRPEYRDDPKNGVIAGYSLYGEIHFQSSEMDQFRWFQDQVWKGQKPIVFTLGSAAHFQLPHFYEIAAQACEELKSPGVLLTGDLRAPPTRVPNNVLVVPYLPLSEVLGDCSGIAHHGGAGTMAGALSAKIPQIIMPTAFDQFDNAERVCTLGVGARLRLQQLRIDSLAYTIRQLLDPNLEFGSRARNVGYYMQCEGNGADRAAQLIQSKLLN